MDFPAVGEVLVSGIHSDDKCLNIIARSVIILAEFLFFEMVNSTLAALKKYG
jgi:hypothetical protein